MDTKVNYTMVGLFVVGLTVALILIGIWLSAGLDRKVYLPYAVYFRESVSGLELNAAVKFNGVNVGYVEKISLNPRNPQEVELILEIGEGIPITETTKATLTTQGLTGLASVELTPGPVGSPPLVKKPGYDYPIIQSAPSFLNRLDIMVGEVAQALNRLFSPENQKALTHVFTNLEKVTTVLADHSTDLGDSLRSTSIILKNTSDASGDFPQASRYFSNQLMPNADTTLQQLDSLSRSLSELTQQLEQNPSLLLRGRAPATPGPGEQ